MKRLTIHTFDMMGRHYLLLPKLNEFQAEFMSSALAERGLRVDAVRETKVRKGGDGPVIHLAPEGLCWSAADVDDHVLPIIPELIAMRKVRTSAKAIWNRYLNVKSHPGGTTVRLSTRMEYGALWKILRGSGMCALAPDEHALVGLLLSKSERVSGLVTDFPTEGGVVKVIGHFQYYKSTLPGPEAARLLRSVENRGAKNVYLPRDGVLELGHPSSVSSRETAGAIAEVREWCGFDLPKHKGSN